MDQLPTDVLAKVVRCSGEDVVLTLAQVCQEWNNRFFGVPTEDQPLWNRLLTERGWPGTGRNDFLNHYEAVRNLKAIRLGIDKLLSTQHNSDDTDTTSSDTVNYNIDNECSCHAIEGNDWSRMCVAVKVIPDCESTAVVVGYDDCTTRIFTKIRDSVDGRQYHRGFRGYYHEVPTSNEDARLTAMEADDKYIAYILNGILNGRTLGILDPDFLETKLINIDHAV